MRRLLLTSATTLLALAVLVPPAWAEWIWPVRGEVITPYRNGSDPYASGQHRGIDIAGDVGAPVVAAAAGAVRFAGTAGSSGVTVSIRTADGRFDTSYLHLASTSVREGDRVGAGHRIGTVGTTGTRSATAPHLHFGVRDAGSRHAYHDPTRFLPPAAAGPRPPRETPGPNPAPAPVSPAPAPAPAPVHAPEGQGRPVQAPGGRRVPVGAPNGRRVPLGAPNRRRVPVGAPNGRRVPLGAPNGRRSPVGAPNGRRSPVGAPHGRRVPVTAPHGRRVPVTALTGRQAPVTAPIGRRVPVAAPHARRRPVTARPGRGAVAASDRRPSPFGPPSAGSVPTAGSEPDPVAAHSGTSRSATPSAGSGPSAERSSQGPDLGLVLACIGLLAAAALLGLTQDGQKAARRTRKRVARALEPLLGRR